VAVENIFWNDYGKNGNFFSKSVGYRYCPGKRKCLFGVMDTIVNKNMMPLATHLQNLKFKEYAFVWQFHFWFLSTVENIFHLSTVCPFKLEIPSKNFWWSPKRNRRKVQGNKKTFSKKRKKSLTGNYRSLIFVIDKCALLQAPSQRWSCVFIVKVSKGNFLDAW